MSPGKVQLLRQKNLPLIGVGKHLCGAATGESRLHSDWFPGKWALTQLSLWSQIWLCAVCWEHEDPERRGNHHQNASKPQNQKPCQKLVHVQTLVQTLVQVQTLVLVRCWAWCWRCAATTAVSGSTTWGSSSSCRTDSELPSSRPSAGCPAGPRVDSDRPIGSLHLGAGPIREETMKSTKRRTTGTQ